MMAVLGGCEKTHEPGTADVTVKMIDAPADMEAVNIEVLGVMVGYDDMDSVEETDDWVSLATTAGVYNLLDLKDGVSVVLSKNVTIPAGRISQIRLILGNKNSVVIDRIAYPLEAPSVQSSGLKINVHQTLKRDKDYEITLDFKADQSIVVLGNGGFLLKPVITVDSITEL